MLEVQVLRNTQQEVITALQKRGINAEASIAEILKLDDERKSTQNTLDNLLAESNRMAKEIGQLMKAGDKEGAEGRRALVPELKVKQEKLKSKQTELEQQLLEALYNLPNTPHAKVVAGKSAEDNEEVMRKDVALNLPANPLPHWELTKKYDLIDFELGVKITGAGFPVYKGKGAKLQRALIQFFLDKATDAGYQEIIPPLMVNEASGYGTGQLPDKEGQMYHMQTDDLYMIPTAEVPITNLYRNEIVKESDLPIKMTGYTPCFRREAGSYGKDVRGLNRLHQFDKVELVEIQHPEKSYETLETMVNHVCGLLDDLELPYRKLRLCGGDMGFTSAMTYDLEVFSGAQEKWLEVSSVSNFETFQANRLKLRYKDADGKKQLAHTLNGSALALPRIVAALLENHQTENGINIPKALQPYTGFAVID